jgi:hypothetical protein
MSGKSYEQEFELEQQRMAVSPCQQGQQQTLSRCDDVTSASGSSRSAIAS